MKKSKLTSGDNMYIVQVRHFVTLGVFSVAITDHFYNKSDYEGLCNLTKKLAKEILYNQLKWQGESGEYHNGFFEAATDVIDERQKFYSRAKDFVIKNYPYLLTP